MSEVTITFNCPTCCEQGTPCSQLECRTRGGEVQLCGFPEYPGKESTPPRFYLERLFGGDAVVCTCINECTPIFPDVLTCTINKTTNTVGVDCHYGGMIEFTNIYKSGTNVACDIRVTLDIDTGKCEGLLVQASAGGALFLSGPGKSGTYSKDGSTGVTGTFCAGRAESQVSGSLEMDIPGTPGTTQCSISKYVLLDSPITSDIISYSGSSKFDPAIDCLEPVTLTGLRTASSCTSFLCVSEHSVCGGTTTSAITSAFTSDAFLDTYLSVKETTATMISQHTPYDCSAGLGAAAKGGSERYEQLQAEDTEEDALLRLTSSPEFTWSDWQIVLDGTGGTCKNPECCESRYEIRTDRTFEYREAEFRGTQSGLTPGQEVDLTIRVYRKPYVSAGPFVIFADLEYDDVPADVDGKAIVTGTVPIAEGFRTFVRCIKRDEPEPP